jgi:putative proteasome-type protease
LVSLDATTRSNITVGPPFEVAIYPKDSMKLSCRCSFDASDPYLINLRESWNTGINNVFSNLPTFENNGLAQQSIEFPTTQAQAQAQAEQMTKPQRQIT